MMGFADPARSVSVIDDVFRSWDTTEVEAIEPDGDGSPPSRAHAAGVLRKRVDRLVAGLRDERYVRELQGILDGLAGQSFASYEDNLHVVGQLNAAIRALGLTVYLRDTEQQVHLRCIRPPRSKRGTIQARSADRNQKSLASGECFPAVVVR